MEKLCLQLILVTILSVLTLARLSQCQTGEMLKYTISEGKREVPYIASVISDAGLADVYDRHLLQTFQFSVVTVKPLSAEYFTFKNLGELHQTRDIDRDTICPHQADCYIDMDIGIKPVEYFQLIKVRISLTDLNDNAPEFPQDEITVHISEMTSPGAVFAIPAAEDPDSGTNSIQKYSLLTRTNKFELKVNKDVESNIQSETLQLVLKRKLDHENTAFYSLKLMAWDDGIPQKSGSVMINIQVDDANDNNPTFQNTTVTVTVPENVSNHTSIAQLHATDLDQGDNGKVTYSFSKVTQELYGDIFQIDAESGEVIVVGTVDYEDRSLYYLTVVAQDAAVSPLAAYAKVIIEVEDINDHSPQLTINAMTPDGHIQIKENAPLGTFVAHVSVLDPDTGRNGEVTCVLDSHYFDIEKLYNTELKVISTAVFDREVINEYNLSISCEDAGLPVQYSVTPITITITDENDYDPEFAAGSYDFNIQENNEMGAFITRLNATDLDIGDNANISYVLEMWESSLFLQLDPLTGVVTANVQFDREMTNRFEFVVIAQDDGHPQRSASVTMTLTVEDVNDEAPKFRDDNYIFWTYENQDVGTEIGTVQAYDDDSSPHNKIVYELDSQSADSSLFDIDSNSGKITTRQVLDREMQEHFNIIIIARDPDSDLEGSVDITVLVADRNDNAPLLLFPNQINNTVEILGLPRVGDVITQIEAYDLDLGINAALTYRLMTGDTYDVFEVSGQLGTVVLKKDLRDYSGKMFELMILVEDDGDEKLSSIETLYVFVNNSAAVEAAAAATTSQLDYSNTLLILSLTLLPLVFIVLGLLLLYTWRRHQERLSQRRKYNCRVQAARALETIALEKSNNTDGLDRDFIYRSYDAHKKSYDAHKKSYDAQKLNVQYDVNDNTAYKKDTSLWLQTTSPLPLIQVRFSFSSQNIIMKINCSRQPTLKGNLAIHFLQYRISFFG